MSSSWFRSNSWPCVPNYRSHISYVVMKVVVFCPSVMSQMCIMCVWVSGTLLNIWTFNFCQAQGHISTLMYSCIQIIKSWLMRMLFLFSDSGQLSYTLLDCPDRRDVVVLIKFCSSKKPSLAIFFCLWQNCILAACLELQPASTMLTHSSKLGAHVLDPSQSGSLASSDDHK